MKKFWGEKEDRYVREHWEQQSDAEMAEALGFTRRLVEKYRQMMGCLRYSKSRLRLRGISGAFVLWDTRSRYYLQQHWRTRSDREISTALGCKETAVKQERLRRGWLRGAAKNVGGAWSPVEVDYLQQHWRVLTDAQIAQVLGRPKGAVCAKRNALHLNWPNGKYRRGRASTLAPSVEVWTPEKDELLRVGVATGQSLTRVSRFLGIPVGLVRLRCEALSLGHRAKGKETVQRSLICAINESAMALKGEE